MPVSVNEKQKYTYVDSNHSNSDCAGKMCLENNRKGNPTTPWKPRYCLIHY